MKRKERDFVALFNAFWYRDFPITPERIDISRRALWTTHIATTVKHCADHLGLFTCFESGGKTDAVIQYAYGKVWSKAEWEWSQPKHCNVDEIIKLAVAKDEAEVFIYIGYSDASELDENLASIQHEWRAVDKPLLVFLITFSRTKGSRKFELLQTYLFKSDTSKLLRKQKALPWEVKGSKWYVGTDEDF